MKLTPALRAALKKRAAKRPKYGNKTTVRHGVKFHSIAEANRYDELLLLEKAGEIESIELQPVYHFIVNGVKVGKYTADFRYRTRVMNAPSAIVVEDVKGVAARDFVLRVNLMKALFGIEVSVIGASRGRKSARSNPRIPSPTSRSRRTRSPTSVHAADR